MADFDGLFNRYVSLYPEILELARSGRRTLIVTHIDADGLASGSLVFAALRRRGANIVLRAVPDLDTNAIRRLADQKYEFYFLTDLGSTLVSELDAAFNGRFLLIDHHQLSSDDMKNPRVVNAWSYGFDGGREACSSSMAYFFATSIDPRNRNLSSLAVVGAVADRQDCGPDRSLIGLNRRAMEEAQSSGFVNVARDLLFVGRETRPIHESIAATSSPFLRGLTGNRDSVLSALHSSGLPLKDRGAWRTISSLTAEEKSKLMEVIAIKLGQVEGATDTLASLTGEVYTLNFEDPFTPLRDAREYATLLNACGRMSAPAVGASICLGDRSGALEVATKTLLEYRLGINKALEALSEDPTRFEQHGHLVIVKCGGVVDEKLLGPVLSILASTPIHRDKVVVGTSNSGDMELKVSARVGDSYPGNVNLGLVMRDAAERVGGVGGGHTKAAGARISLTKEPEFSKAVEERIVESHS